MDQNNIGQSALSFMILQTMKAFENYKQTFVSWRVSARALSTDYAELRNQTKSCTFVDSVATNIDHTLNLYHFKVHEH